MNMLSVFKTSSRWSQLINKLLMISLWCSVGIFFAIAILILVGGLNWESVRIAFMVSGIGVLLLFFTIFTKRSFEQHHMPKTLTDYYEAALEVEETKGIEAAQEVYETICRSFNTNLGPAYLSLANICLEKNEVRKATEYIQKAAEENWIWYHSGLELLVEYYKKNEEQEKLEHLTKQLEQVKKLEEEACREIYFLNDSDTLIPHDQPLEVFTPIFRVLDQYLKLEELFILEKKLQTIPDRKVYVFALIVDQKDEAKKVEKKIYHDCYEFLAKPLGKYIFFEYTVSFLFLSRQEKQDDALIQRIKQMEGTRVSQRELEPLLSE